MKIISGYLDVVLNIPTAPTITMIIIFLLKMMELGIFPMILVLLQLLVVVNIAFQLLNINVHN